MLHEKIIGVLRDLTIILGILFISFTVTSTYVNRPKSSSLATEVDYPACKGNYQMINPIIPLDNITISKQ
jgi:hypothetical protein